MRILKRFLIGLGAFFAILIVVMALVGGGSLRFKAQQEPFVRAFVTDLSRHWVLEDVRERLANEFVEQAATAQGQSLLREFRLLGPVVTMDELSLRTYNVTPSAQMGVFSLKATFVHGEAVVSITVVRRDRETRVQSLYMTGRRILEQLPARNQT